MSSTPLAPIFEQRVPAGGNRRTVDISYYNPSTFDLDGDTNNIFLTEVSPNMRQIHDLGIKHSWFTLEAGNSELLLSGNRFNFNYNHTHGIYSTWSVQNDYSEAIKKYSFSVSTITGNMEVNQHK